ncbi:hypothetical protein QE152_g6915 [Popillia japonica]|uniref:Uncharacterized protein n=1 Tax=Popillia japonica TaxID=7064 RepID=A0AAW1MGR1_POPJA
MHNANARRCLSVYFMINAQRKYNAQYDKHRFKNVKYDVRDIVFMKSAIVSTGEFTKLQRKYRGPITITKVLPGDTYAVTELRESNGRRKQWKTVCDDSQLKIRKSSKMEKEEQSDQEMNEIGQDEEEAEVLSWGQTDKDVQTMLRENKGEEVNADNQGPEEDSEQILDEVSELKKQKHTRTIPKYFMNYKLY